MEYVGHPLVEVVEGYREQDAGSSILDLTQRSHDPASGIQHLASSIQYPESNIIALLPGSHKQEILKKLPIMLEVTKHFPDYRFVVAKAPGLEESFYTELLAPYSNVSSVEDKTYGLLMQSKAALVTSGTATLETTLFGVPEVICYKGNALSYQIAKRLIKIKFIQASDSPSRS